MNQRQALSAVCVGIAVVTVVLLVLVAMWVSREESRATVEEWTETDFSWW